MNIAVTSNSSNNCTETFIQNLVRQLPGNVHFLLDGYLPRQYSIDRGQTANFFLVKDDIPLTEEKLVNSIENYLTANQIDIILCLYGPAGLAMLPIARKLQIPLVVHFYGFDAYRNDVLSYYGPSYKHLFLDARAVVVVSADMNRQLVKLGCSASKIATICCGGNTGMFNYKTRQNASPVYVACGRFVAKKAPHLTIAAFKKVVAAIPDATLIMIGDGPLLDSCKALVYDLNVSDAVHFKGRLTPEMTEVEFARASVFVQHSIHAADGDSEGTPVVILEAMASGLPIVSTRHAGIPDIVEEEENGLLVDENDIDAMAENMIWLARNPLEATIMGRQGSKKVHQNYTIVNYTRQITHLLEQAHKN